MKRKLLSIFTALVLALSLCLVTAVPVAAADVTVSGGESIQTAITTAGVGGTITVDATYTGAGDTFPIIVDVADVTIQASPSATIDGGGNDWVPAVEITATGVTLKGFTISNFEADATNDYGAVSVVQGVGATIQGNTIYNIGDTEPPFGIGIDVAANNVDVIGNTVYDTGSIGIRVYGPFGGTTTGVLVENNEVYHTGNTGVVFANTVSNSTIRGNHLYDSLDPTPYNLFLCWGFDKVGPPSDILIEGNTISGGYGNIVLAGAEYITITGNTITGAVPLTTNGKNIYILSDYLQGTHYLSTYITITNNDITGAEGYGVRISYTGTEADGALMASTTTINNNNIYGNTDFGVENTIETPVDATSNWWGAADGPSPIGSGDLVSDNVDSTGFLTQAQSSVVMTGNPIILPTVVTDAASAVGLTSATLNGNLTNMGTATSVDVWFQWGTTIGYGQVTSTETMTDTGAFTAELTGLDQVTEYHFRAVAFTPDGTILGLDAFFTTTERIGISVSPTSIDFGSILAGASSASKTVTVTNEGNIVETFTATLTGTDAIFYTANLEIDTIKPVTGWSAADIAVDVTATPGLVLTMPSDVTAGTKTATIIFWAEASP